LAAETAALRNSHNEVVLMAGSLGVSALVCLLNNGDDRQTETQANLLGPFWREDQPLMPNGASLVRSLTPGPALTHVRVEDKQGRPVEGAEVDVWHSSPEGLYEIQDPTQAEMNLRGPFLNDREGRFHFKSVPNPLDIQSRPMGRWASWSRPRGGTTTGRRISTS
jgi:catechol 1,2-dioxygenase